MTTVIVFYNHATNQYYMRLKPGIISDLEKSRLLKDMSAVNAGDYDWNAYPENCNRLYFQEFEQPDTNDVYFNINGDRPIYDLIQKYRREPEYYI